jgi:hypothetical protein
MELEDMELDDILPALVASSARHKRVREWEASPEQEQRDDVDEMELDDPDWHHVGVDEVHETTGLETKIRRVEKMLVRFKQRDEMTPIEQAEVKLNAIITSHERQFVTVRPNHLYELPAKQYKMQIHLAVELAECIRFRQVTIVLPYLDWLSDWITFIEILQDDGKLVQHLKGSRALLGELAAFLYFLAGQSVYHSLVYSTRTCSRDIPWLFGWVMREQRHQLRHCLETRSIFFELLDDAIDFAASCNETFVQDVPGLLLSLRFRDGVFTTPPNAAFSEGWLPEGVRNFVHEILMGQDVKDHHAALLTIDWVMLLGEWTFLDEI